jgi:S-adenosylmethionine synthetase
MKIDFFADMAAPSSLPFEIVERKGNGHPDTLADHLAEKLSIAYSKQTKQEQGLILRHQFDKLLLMGGRCNVSYGKGNFISPIRLVLNGRVTQSFGETKINYRDLIYSECELFLEQELQNFKFSKDCKVIFETTSNSTRGLIDNSGTSPINYRFSPRSANDLPEFKRPIANDTALGFGFAPFTALENLVLEIEQTLTSHQFQNKYPWIGTDIKIMGYRIKERVEITLAIPQISTEVKSLIEYQENINLLKELILNISSSYKQFEISIFVNPSDNPSEEVVYLRYTGSCIESGDEGAVARGNRIGGVISACRPYSIEGINGKNPSYHAGKIYSAAAWEIASKIWTELEVACEVFILSQIDRPLDDPWQIFIKTNDKVDNTKASRIAEEILSNFSSVTNRFLDGYYTLT